MKVLYVGSNPDDEDSLNLDREITELQRRTFELSTEPVQFIFLPRLSIEDLPSQLMKHQPDVLHLAAHGNANTLTLTNDAGMEVKITAETLKAFISNDRPPDMVYINACNSSEIARELLGAIRICIGVSAPIKNRTARAAAVVFYERLLSGSPVYDAFKAGQKMIEAMQNQAATAMLFARPDADPKSLVLHRVPKLVALFPNDRPVVSDGECSIRLGLIGCPPNTTQVVFFTDDETFLHDTPESDLALIVRGTTVRGEMWADEDDTWDTWGDFRICAAGMTADGRSFTVCSWLSEGIETFYRLSGQGMLEEQAKALAHLRNNDGSMLATNRNDSGSVKKRRLSPKKKKG